MSDVDADADELAACRERRGGHSHLCDLPRLVVATQDGDAVPVPHFQRHQQAGCLHRVVPASSLAFRV